MPFYKWVIGDEDSKLGAMDSANALEHKKDLNAATNLCLVHVIRHLSELAKTAHEIYGAIEEDCKNVFQRTNDLKMKVQNFQSIVDNLNAKSVKVPVSSLTDPPPVARFESRHEEGPIFCTLARPPAVSRLCQLATDPRPPPAATDGKAATHIYCQPLPENHFNMCRNSIYSEKSSICDNMTSPPVPSTVVPIDVSGRPFSRMASLRRSLIHVDFFVRRKKDKRRNTVTEGDTKELKDALHNIINGKKQSTFTKSNRHSIETDHANHANRKNSGENGNILPSGKSCHENNQKFNERNKYISLNQHGKMDLELNQEADIIKPSVVNKRKLKSHIPISTFSAAMNVAVEMRESNGKKSEEHSSSGNWSCSSSDTEKKNSSQNSSNGTIFDDALIQSPEGIDSSGFKSSSDFDDSISKKKVYLQSCNETFEQKTEISDYNSSDNATTQDDASSSATSAESEVFFMSSDESDEEDSDLVLEQNFGSSLSISTISNGSLNSLLSQTGTEMTSSTGTLTSVGFDRLPTPPPPPIVSSTSPIRNDKETAKPKSGIFAVKNSSEFAAKNKSEKNAKHLKPQKHEKNSTDKSKKLFSSLVSIKPRTKSKNNEPNKNEIKQQPYINMYGNSSPETLKRVPSFIKENISPHTVNEPRNNCMQSFSSQSSKHEIGIFQTNNRKPPIKDSKEQTHSNTQSLTNNTAQNILKSNDTCTTSENKGDIPLKYEHKVTVTPIQRQTECESSTLYNKSINNSQQRSIVKNLKEIQQPTANISLNETNEMYYTPRPQRPMTLKTEKMKSVARVLLDPEGKVIKTTNSLDRNLQSPLMHYLKEQSGSSINKYHTDCIVKLKNENICYWNRNLTQRTPNSHSNSESLYSNYTNERHENVNSCTPTSTKLRARDSIHPDLKTDMNKNYTPNLIHQAQRENKVQGRKNICPEEIPDKKRTAKVLLQDFQHPVAVPPNPNTSGLPMTEATLNKQYNGDTPMKKETLNKSIGEKHFTQESPSSTSHNMTSPLHSDITKRHQSTMSTEDLFAVIHNCKKKMNIKTDSDVSLNSSSRSSSPSYSRPASSKGTLAETGFLSPRKLMTLDNPGDRRSWADFRPSNSVPNERKSLASDRLGPTKPTSMHDFKMLLLQTRSTNQSLGPRKSAVEMLKVSTPPDKTISANDSPAYSVPNSPSSETYLYNGHSTVPFKRNRARASLQLRYTMYPPIFEDCLEESDSNRHSLQNSSRKNLTDLEETHEAKMTHNVDNNYRENMVWL